MPTYAGKRVNADWKTVLEAAHDANVAFTLNSGQRTLAEQWKLYRQNMSGGRPRPGHALTAFPSPNAPHIRRNHAIDVDSRNGGARRLAAWLRSHGVHPAFPVTYEPWHMVVPPVELARFAAAIRAASRSRARSEAAYRGELTQAYKDRARQTRASRVGFFNRRIQAIKRRLRRY